MVGCDVKNGHQKDMFEREWITCSKFAKHSKCSSQHRNCGDLCDQLITQRIFALTINSILMQALKNM